MTDRTTLKTMIEKLKRKMQMNYIKNESETNQILHFMDQDHHI